MLKRIGLAVAVMIGAGAANAADKPSLRLCAGTAGGNYHFAAAEIGNRVSTAFEKVTVVATKGSLDNLRKLSAGECDMAFAQSDVTDLYKLENPQSIGQLMTVKSVYSEYVHILCPTAPGWSRITHVGKAKARMYVGPEGSGSAETWRALRKADESLYGNLERVPESGMPALSAVKDSNNACMVWVSGLNSADMQAANLMSINTRDKKPALTLIDVDDRDFKSIKGSDGKPMYKFESISRKKPSGGQPGLYDNLMQSSSVTVPVVDALLISRKEYYDNIRPQLPRLLTAIEDASPTIWKRVNPAQ